MFLIFLTTVLGKRSIYETNPNRILNILALPTHVLCMCFFCTYIRTCVCFHFLRRFPVCFLFFFFTYCFVARKIPIFLHKQTHIYETFIPLFVLALFLFLFPWKRFIDVWEKGRHQKNRNIYGNDRRMNAT